MPEGWYGGGGGSLVPVEQNLFGLWDGTGKNAAGNTPVDLPGLWKDPRSGRECSQKPTGAWLGRPKRLYGEFRRK